MGGVADSPEPRRRREKTERAIHEGRALACVEGLASDLTDTVRETR
jgi:hypothetical protein